MSGDVRHRRASVNGVQLEVTESGDPTAPPVILSHGFPEGAYSWRHQLGPLADAGFHAIAPDQRGYGWSSAPIDVAAYRVDRLAGDLIGLLDETGHETGVFVGHDWGALIVWHLALLHPERVRAVVGVSVPFVAWPAPPTQLFKALYGDRFFYMLYFQEVGPAEQELGADPYRTMAKTLWGASGDADLQPPAELPPMAGTGFLSMMPDPPQELPSWLTRDDIDAYGRAFAHSGWFGPLGYYRNLDADYDLVKDLPASRISMPSYFIGGERDMVTRNPAILEGMKASLPDLRGVVLLPGVGHWIQQEAPGPFNDALLAFLRTL